MSLGCGEDAIVKTAMYEYQQCRRGAEVLHHIVAILLELGHDRGVYCLLSAISAIRRWELQADGCLRHFFTRLIVVTGSDFSSSQACHARRSRRHVVRSGSSSPSDSEKKSSKL